MIKGNNGIIKNEKGAFFVFGPWWFVIVVMIIGIIASLLRNNNVKNTGANQINDYEPINSSSKPVNADNICPKCGKNNSELAKFGNGCGSSLTKNLSIYCPRCGESNSNTAKFCQECGKELNIID